MRYDHESMLPIRAFMKVGGRMTLEGGGKGSQPAAPDYSSIAQSNKEAAQIAQQTAREQMAFQRQVYNESKPQQERLYDLASRVANQQMEISNQNQQHANQQWDYYDRTYKPLEQRMVKEAETYDSKARQEQQAGQATADVRSQMANVNAQQNRAMLGMGVNPNSGRFAGLSKSQSIQTGASVAGAATGARNAVVDKGIGLRAGAAGFGRNMPNTAAQAYGLATGAGSAAVGSQNTGFMAGTAYPGLLNSGYSNMINAQGQQMNANLGYGQLLNQGYGIQAGMYNANAGAEGAAIGAGIGLLGMVGARGMASYNAGNGT